MGILFTLFEIVVVLAAPVAFFVSRRRTIEGTNIRGLPRAFSLINLYAVLVLVFAFLHGPLDQEWIGANISWFWFITGLVLLVAANALGRSRLPSLLVYLLAFVAAVVLVLSASLFVNTDALPGWLGALFAILAVALVIGALIILFAGAVIVAGLAAVAMILFGLFVPAFNLLGGDKDVQEATNKPRTQTSSTPSVSPPTCRFTVEYDQNYKDRLDSDGIPSTADAREALDEVLGKASADPRVLVYSYNKLFSGPNFEASDIVTEDEKCLNVTGEDVYHNLEGVYRTVLTKSKVVDIPSTVKLVNTYAKRGGEVYDKKERISGNRKALQMTLPNGQRVYYLYRCGNMVTPPDVKEIPPPRPPRQPQPEQPKPDQPAPSTPAPSTPPPTKAKCDNGDADGDGQCGTSRSGPEQQPVQDNDPELVKPTDGYVAGNAEKVAEAQVPVPGADPYEPTQYGTNSGSTSGSPSGQTENTDTGTTETGGTAGTSDPEPITEDTGNTSTGDPGPPP